MYPPIFKICSQSTEVTDLLGTAPVRLWPFGEAPQDTELPYAVWQTISGSPDNYISDLPDVDSYTLQIDVYADTVTEARSAAEALRNAIEPVAHVTRWSGDGRDPTTRHYRFSFDVDWIVQR